MIKNALYVKEKIFLQDNLGWYSFQLGVFFLPSSAFISYIFLFISLIEGSYKRKDSYWSEYWNYPLVLVTFFMLIGSIRAQTGWLAFIGLFNWFPFFWAFWAFQPYLLTDHKRKKCAFWLLMGTFPVLLTGFGQLWLGWEGPWDIFNGLIIWFVSPGGQPEGRFSGLFDYANITAAWLSAIWPFCLASFLQPFGLGKNRILPGFFLLLFVVAMILTDSRNAWGSIFLALPLVFGSPSWIWLIPLMMLSLLPILFAVLPGIHFGIQQVSRSIVPDWVWMRLNDLQFVDTRPLESTRIGQWKVAINLIFEKPYFGWGAAAFSIIYTLRTGLYHGHSHNLPLELAINHGVFVSFLINIFVFSLVIASAYSGILSVNNLYGRAWFAATLILICFHATDMPFFDSRINMLGWILLIGLRCSILKPKIGYISSI